MGSLVHGLIQQGYLRSDHIIDAFSSIPRVEFVPEKYAHIAEANIPLPIGYGQTISQPLTVAFMLELLQPKEGHNILDVGSGSGWTTALLGHIVGEKGKVTALEIVPELYERGKKNVEKFGFVSDGRVEFHNIDGAEGYAPNAPYDRILVSAAADKVPEPLKEQLAIGGRMVIPIHNTIWLLEKKAPEEFHKEEFPGFSFVPLVRQG